MAITSSVFSRLLARVRSAVMFALAMTERDVRVRRRIAYFRDHDPLPLVVIAPEAERLFECRMGDGVNGGDVGIDYPVTVAYLTQSNIVAEGVEDILDRRPLIRQALHVTTFPGLDEVYDVVGYDPS